jgi:hypothetical protein
MKTLAAPGLFVALVYMALNPLVAQTPGTLKWQIDLNESSYYSTPAIGDDSTIYVGGEDSLFAVSSDGQKKWALYLGSDLNTPAISQTKTIYVTTRNGMLYSITSDGIKNWELDMNSYIYSCSPSIGYDGTLYLASDDHNLYAINPDKTIRWKVNIGMNTGANPSISFDGTIYIGSRDGTLYAISTDGTIIWKQESIYPEKQNMGNWFGSPAIDQHGDLYAGCRDFYLYALTKKGEIKWTYETEHLLDDNITPVIDEEGTVYAGTGKTLYAINNDGTKKWTYQAGSYGYFEGTPVVGSDGTIYANFNDSIIAISNSGQRKWGIYLNLSDQSPVMDHQGTLFVNGGYPTAFLYAIYTNSEQLANSSWPKYNCNPKNTGFIKPQNEVLDELSVNGMITGKYAKACGANIIKVLIANQGMHNQSNFDVFYGINDEIPHKETVNKTLTPYQSVTITFSDYFIPDNIGDYNITAWIEPRADVNSENNRIQKDIQVINTKYTGDWTGKTSKNKDVFVHVNGFDEVDSVALKISVNFVTYTCIYLFYSNTPTKIENDQFELHLSNPFIYICEGSNNPEISGIFSTSDTCSGEITSFQQCGGYCDGNLTIGSGSTVSSLTWAAGNTSEFLLSEDIPSDCNISGTDPVIKNPGISVYPNPANNILFIDGAENEDVEIIILSIEGKLFKKVNGKGMNQIDISELGHGVYIVKIASPNVVITNKLIKQ